MEKIKDALKKARSGGVQPGNLSSLRKKDNTLKHDEVLDKIIYNQENVVEVNNNHLEQNRIVALDKMNHGSWVFDALRTQVLQKLEENNWQTIAIISPTQASGKTVMALNLAISIAQTPNKTSMVVDFDMRKPKVSKYLGISSKKSLNDYLNNEADLGEIIVNPSIPRFTIIPTNTPVKKSSEILSLSKVKNLMVDLKDRYDSRVIIYDLPPILQADDAMIVLPQVDCALIVVSDGANTEAELIQTMRLLDKVNVLGVVVNKSEEVYRSYY
jgi:capsular exopolysaccharide synthesis family protein